MEDLYNYVNPLNKRHSPMISKETLDIVLENKDVSKHEGNNICLCFWFSNWTNYVSLVLTWQSRLLQLLNSAIIYDRDFSYNFFGFKVRLCFWYNILTISKHIDRFYFVFIDSWAIIFAEDRRQRYVSLFIKNLLSWL